MSRVQSSWLISAKRIVAPSFFERAPGRDVGVVIEMGQHDFVARTKLTSDGAADGVGERGHVGTEDDFVRIATQKICHGGAGVIDDGVRAAAGGIGAAGVGVRSCVR